MDKIDAMGGAVTAIENDYVQNEIAAASYEYQLQIEAGKRVIVGVNRFVQKEEGSIEGFRIDDSIRITQSDKIALLKSERDNIAVQQALSNLKDIAINGGNLMPGIVLAVELYATLGEISDIFRQVFGEH
jgi:methylmalonyl-CoA mutase N-terminal domain/subunit